MANLNSTTMLFVKGLLLCLSSFTAAFVQEHLPFRRGLRHFQASHLNGDLKSKRLVPPAPFSSVDKAPSNLASGHILPMMWEGEQLSRNAFRVGLPPQLLGELRGYADRMGITEFYRGLVVFGEPYQPGQNGMVRFEGFNWLIQRPKSHWRSNMHWTSPADEEAHNDYLTVLSSGGFDQVLEAIGEHFGLDGLSAYHLSFIAVSHCEKGFIHADVSESGRKAFNLIIPLILSDDTGPELEILSDDESKTRHYQYEYNVASMVGDDALHATAACDYRLNGVMRMAATIYVGDINPENVEQILVSLTQAYPPEGDSEHLLDRAGGHWSKSDQSKRLPTPHDGAVTIPARL